MKKVILCFAVILLTIVSAQGSWTPRKLIGTYPDWNYWWLNVRIGIDQFDTVYCAVSRYNYSQNDYEHDLYVLNTEGDTINVIRPWSGFDYQPIVQDAQGTNIYLGQPVLGQGQAGSPHMDAGVTDDSNCVSTTHSRNSVIYFTRLGPSGQHIIWLDSIYSGNPWSGRTSLARDPRGNLHCTFADDRQFLVYGISPDYGITWIWDTLETISVMSHVRVVATLDTCVHIVFRTWTSGVQLYYMKLRPDGTVAIAPSIFAQGSERWCPNVAIDTTGHLRVVYIDGSSQAHNLWYTALRGDLDTGGQPVPDSLLTLVPDTIIQNDAVRVAGPKICVDSYNRAHVLFEQGVYGTGGTKHVYHIREEGGPWVGEYATESRSTLLVSPNPMFSSAKMQFNLAQPARVQLILYDALGRKVRDILNCAVAKGLHTIQFDRADLSSGTYFLVFKKDSESRVVKIVIVE